MEKTFNKVELDKEWLVLINKAKHLGITVEEIRTFLQQATKKSS